MNTKSIISIIAVFMLLVMTLATVRIQTVYGHEVGVKETWGGGVINEVLPPKTYVLIPGFMQKIYKYSVGQQKYVMNDVGDVEFGEGRPNDAYVVQSSDQQSMRISMAIQWRRDPLMAVELHKTLQDNIEERLLRPELMRIVKDEATTLTALEAYAGSGLVRLQQSIQNKLRHPEGELHKRGVIIDNFVIEHIGLDKKYIGEIEARQVAVQARLRNIEETKAAEEAANKAKAEAQADYERQVVAARRDKEVGILSAQKSAEQQVLAATASARQVELAAEAEKNRNILNAEGDKEAGYLRANAIEALGAAEAEATKLKLQAYAVQGADAFVKIEVAKSMADAFKNIQGYLPESMNVTLLAEQYTSGVNLLVNPQQ